MIIFVTLLIMTFSLKGMSSNSHKGFKPIGDKYWSTIGFSFYAFEGIGTLLPIMIETESPKHFPSTVKCALISLSLYFTLFGFSCYMYFGDD